MAALLQTTTSKPQNTQSSILYGAGNPDITDEQIKAFISQPGMTPDQIQAAAVKNNVSADQISTAMVGNPAYTPIKVDNYLSKQGIAPAKTSPIAAPLPLSPVPPQGPAIVTPNTINVNPNTDTVQGQMNGILKDTNNPLMVQARTFATQEANRRGLANSSIAATAGEDAMIRQAMPMATQDASTYYNANTSNVTNKLNADMFNSDIQSRILMNREQINSNQYIAQLDTDTKMKIAQIQAQAGDASIMGQTNLGLMELVQKISSDPNMSPDAKNSALEKVYGIANTTTGLLTSFENTADLMTYPSSGSGSSGTGDAGTGSDTSGTTGPISVSTGKPISSINSLNYQVEPSVMGNVIAYEKATGTKIDPRTVVPQALIEDLRYGPLTPNFGAFYIGADGQSHIRNSAAYDYNKLMKEYGVKNHGELFDAMFVAAQPPGTMRTDSPMFYVYR